jgi:protein-L-isoaspartate(D-aspartate) O-methyltransferase
VRFPEKFVPVSVVAALAAGMVIGLTFGLLLPALVSAQSEPVVSYEKAAALFAPEESVETAAAGNSSEYDLSFEVSPGAKSYDGPALAKSMTLEPKEAWLSWMRTNRNDNPAFLEERYKLAMNFIESSELKRPEDVRAFLLAPREHFVRTRNRGLEYADTWLPIGYGATITDPDVVAMMTTSLNISPGDRVLEIGTGSGYQSAILSYLTQDVYTIEIIKPLYIETDNLYRDLEKSFPSYGGISRKLGDGYYGWENTPPLTRS